ncbi:MAG: UvrD-helicase domain-containing protein [Anaerolineae bacterium]|nr:UvrD-helicase domain-containing protein [Anaerolineae bacterium]
MVERSNVLEGLNEQQLAAVTCALGTTLVLAGPGSGKTRVLTHRIACLVELHRVEPRSILAVTFTNKAAREMRSRLDSLLGPAAADVTLGTFHSVCARILRREADHFGLDRGFTIYDRDDQIALIKRVLKHLDVDDKRYRPAAVLAAISRAKNDMIGPADYRPPTYWHEVVARIYESYQAALEANQALDFDDLLLAAVRGLESEPQVLARYRRRYRHILVDEFQDTNLPQYRLVRLLCDAGTDLFLVGDEDQSIYGWRGADYRNLARVREDFPSVRTLLLERNYRSSQTILDAAKAVIARNLKRVHKDLEAANGGGEPVTVYRAGGPDEEAEYVVAEIERLIAGCGYRPRDFAVMYRMNAQSRALEEAFMRHRMPYRLVGGTRFYQRREIKDVLAYLRLVTAPNDWVAFDRVINVPPRGLGPVSLGHFRDFASGLDAGPYDALTHVREAEGERTLALTGRALQALLEFGEAWDTLLSTSETATVAEMIDAALLYFGYGSYLRSSGPDAQEKWENVGELRAVAEEHFGPGREELARFLDEVALVADVDELEDQTEAPVLMTLHTAKGLEFPVVFIVGMQEGVLPHSRALEEPEGLEEERRLCYVGMTRAMRRLYLLHSASTRLYGQAEASIPSRFLKEIPAAVVADSAVGPEPRTPAAAQETTEYHPGEIVHHPKFGRGVVVEYRSLKDDAEVSVAFEGQGVKRLLVSLASLTKG